MKTHIEQLAEILGVSIQDIQHDIHVECIKPTECLRAMREAAEQAYHEGFKQGLAAAHDRDTSDREDYLNKVAQEGGGE